MSYTFPAQVAWNAGGSVAVKNAAFRVYAVSDTSFTSPLAILDANGVPIPGNVLNSGSAGVFPQFQQATNATVVVTDAVHVYAWTINCIPSDTSTAAFINQSGSATQAALNGTYVPLTQKATASGVATLDSGSQLIQTQAPAASQSAPFFNMTPANFPNWRKALSKARAGTASAKLLCAGDSTTWGSGSGAANPPAAAYHAQLITMMNGYHTPTVSGLVIPPTQLTGDLDNRWGVGASWAKNANGWGTASCYVGPVGAGNLTFTPGINCDTFDIYYLTVPGQGTVQASVDGGANTPINTNAANGVAKTTVTAVAGSAHVLTLGTVTVQSVFIVGVDAYLATAKNVRVGNAGVGSTTSGGWNAAGGYGSLDCIKAYVPDLTILSLGINDANANMTLSTWQTNMQAIITAAKVSGDVILASVVPSNSTGGNPAQEQVYRDVSLALAQTNNIGYFDLFGRFGSWATMNGLGMMTDNLHPNALGYADMAAGMFAAVRSIS